MSLAVTDPNAAFVLAVSFLAAYLVVRKIAHRNRLHRHSGKIFDIV